MFMHPDTLQPSPQKFQRVLLMAMQTRPIYAGTVPDAEVARRRAANRRAKASRRINRKHR